jgi:hypothetical protein
MAGAHRLLRLLRLLRRTLLPARNRHAALADHQETTTRVVQLKRRGRISSPFEQSRSADLQSRDQALDIRRYPTSTTVATGH